MTNNKAPHNGPVANERLRVCTRGFTMGQSRIPVGWVWMVMGRCTVSRDPRHGVPVLPSSVKVASTPPGGLIHCLLMVPPALSRTWPGFFFLFFFSWGSSCSGTPTLLKGGGLMIRMFGPLRGIPVGAFVHLFPL